MNAYGRMLGAGPLRPSQMLGLGLCKVRSQNFSSCSAVFGKINMMPRKGKMLDKLVSGSSKKRTYKYSDQPRWVEQPKIGTASFLKPKESKSPRRIAVLNSVLMEAITEVMASGVIGKEIFGLGIHISRVKVTGDFSLVNVYWSCSSDVDSDNTEKVLHTYAGAIRSHLCKNHVLGNVPYVCFVKDRHQENVVQVEQLLARADFGPDFKPNDPTHHQKSEFILNRTAPPFPEWEESPKKDQDSDVDNLLKSSPEPLSNVPACIADPVVTNSFMRMDILGLKHVDIMQNVVQNMKKAKAEHRTFPGEVPPPCELETKSPESAALPNHGPALTMSIRHFLEQKKQEKYMSRKQELVDLRNAQFMEECKQGMSLGDPDETLDGSYEEDFFNEEEFFDFNPENSQEPPY